MLQLRSTAWPSTAAIVHVPHQHPTIAANLGLPPHRVASAARSTVSAVTAPEKAVAGSLRCSAHRNLFDMKIKKWTKDTVISS